MKTIYAFFRFRNMYTHKKYYTNKNSKRTNKKQNSCKNLLVFNEIFYLKKIRKVLNFAPEPSEHCTVVG